MLLQEGCVANQGRDGQPGALFRGAGSISRRSWIDIVEKNKAGARNDQGTKLSKIAAPLLKISKRLVPSCTQASAQTAAGEGQAREYPMIPPDWHAADMQQQGPSPGPVGSGAGEAKAYAVGERMRAEIQRVLCHARIQACKVTLMDRMHLRRAMVQDNAGHRPRGAPACTADRGRA